MKKKNMITALILLLTIGFAAVSTTLVINGNILFGTNADNFEVIFTKAILDDNDLSDTAITEDGKTITYETKKLATLGEESILDFTVKNNSTQYDAEININCIGGDNVGIYYELEYDLPDYVEAQSEIDGYVTARMIRSSVNEIIEELTCTLNVTAMERTEVAQRDDTGLQTEILWNDENNDGIRSLGDIVTISKEGTNTERFYIISSDETNTIMMSMYNLYIGGEASYPTGAWVNKPYTNPTGIQDSTMIGLNYEDTSIRNGVTVFSDGSQSGTNYSDYSGSIVEGFVNNYSTFLANVLNIENSATLISKEELEEIAGDTLIHTSNLSELGAPSFIYSTSYWTRSAYSEDYIWCVYSSGIFGHNLYNNYIAFGVRPLVTINTALFEDEVTPQSIVCEGICSDQDENGIVTVGDIITLGDDTTASKEQFYVTSVSEDLSRVSMLSMYNLYVGGEAFNSTEDWVFTSYANPTGIQDSAMIGFLSTSDTKRKGVTPFSSNEQKGTNYSDYSGSIVEGYVNAYSDYLKNALGVENNATLISKETIETIVGSSPANGSYISNLGAPAFLYSSSYWTYSAYSVSNIWNILADGRILASIYYRIYNGVRPLVTISADLI